MGEHEDVAHPEIKSLKKGIEKDYELGLPNTQLAIKEAEKKNLDVVYPNPDQLQIDIDTEHAFQVYLHVKQILDNHYGIKKEEIHFSRSGAPKRHITVTLYQDVDPMERIALQACLGSDRIRELLGVVMLKGGDKTPTLFLEAKKDSDLTKGRDASYYQPTQS